MSCRKIYLKLTKRWIGRAAVLMGALFSDLFSHLAGVGVGFLLSKSIRVLLIGNRLGPCIIKRFYREFNGKKNEFSGLP
jgi:hypothetical protein